MLAEGPLQQFSRVRIVLLATVSSGLLGVAASKQGAERALEVAGLSTLSTAGASCCQTSAAGLTTVMNLWAHKISKASSSSPHPFTYPLTRPRHTLACGSAPRLTRSSCQQVAPQRGTCLGSLKCSRPEQEQLLPGGNGNSSKWKGYCGSSFTSDHPSNNSSAVRRAPAVIPPTPMQATEVLSQDVVHQRYLTVYNRRVKFSSATQPSTSVQPATPEQENKVVDFDVVGHPRANFSFAVIFPFHRHPGGQPGGSVTVVREYAQGPDALMYCLPTGAFDPNRHSSLVDCARCELSEEAMLMGGQWLDLLPQGHPGLAEVKWCMNRFIPFLAIDPHPDPQPGSRDAEELSLEVLQVSLEEFEELMVSGDMLLPSITTGFLAIKLLRQMGLA